MRFLFPVLWAGASYQPEVRRHQNPDLRSVLMGVPGAFPHRQTTFFSFWILNLFWSDIFLNIYFIFRCFREDHSEARDKIEVVHGF